jgi:phosphoketolase
MALECSPFFMIVLLALAKWLDPIYRELLANRRVATFYGQVQNTQTNNADQHKLIMQINNRIDPAEVDGHKVEGFLRAYQVPMGDAQ